MRPTRHNVIKGKISKRMAHDKSVISQLMDGIQIRSTLDASAKKPPVVRLVVVGGMCCWSAICLQDGNVGHEEKVIRPFKAFVLCDSPDVLPHKLIDWLSGQIRQEKHGVVADLV